MPVIVAVGVNLGIVPLLFVQLAYYKVFYPATILMAWFWLAIIVLLIPAYYGVYAYAWGLRGRRASREQGTTVCAYREWGQTFLSASIGTACWRIAAGWCAAVFFVRSAFCSPTAEPDGPRRALAGALGPQQAGAAWAPP